MMSGKILSFLLSALLLPQLILAFVPLARIDQSSAVSFETTHRSRFSKPNHVVPLLMPKRQRQSMAPVQTMGLFGLGGLEIAVICIGVGVVLGPERILELVRSSGDTADEYKKELSRVPDEFKKGMEEGEMEARSRKAKVIEKVTVKDEVNE